MNCVDRSSEYQILFVDGKDIAWIVNRNLGIFKYQDGKLTNYDSLNGFVNDDVLEVYETRGGRLLFSTYRNGLFEYRDDQFLELKIPNLHSTIGTIFEDRDGILWLDTSTGLKTLDLTDTSLFSFKQVKELANKRIFSIDQDNEGAIWMGTSRGAVRYLNGEFKKYDEQEGFTNNAVTKVLADDNDIVWFGTWGFGLYKYQKKPFAVYDTSFGLNHDIVKTVLVDEKWAYLVWTSRKWLKPF